MNMSDRPNRSCDVCGVIDQHPRHIFDTLGVQGLEQTVNEDAVQKAYENENISRQELVAIVSDLRDVSSFTRHMDCCASVGCPDGTCEKIMKDTKNAHGFKLVEAITGEKVS
jgi:hypothetical protein